MKNEKTKRSFDLLIGHSLLNRYLTFLPYYFKAVFAIISVQTVKLFSLMYVVTWSSGCEVEIVILLFKFCARAHNLFRHK